MSGGSATIYLQIASALGARVYVLAEAGRKREEG